MAEINDWQISAANNNSAPPNGWPESTMQYSEVNDTGREGMAVLARYFKDSNGSLAAAGVVNAYTLTLNAAYLAYFAGMSFSCSIPITNTGAATINVNTLGVKSIVNPDGGAVNAGQLQAGGIYRFVYDGTNFQLIGQGAYGALAQQDTVNNDDWSGTDLAVANGGTGASDAATARTNLGVAIGTNVQAWDADLDAIAALATTAFGRGLLTEASATTARTTLGVAIGSDVQAWDAHLDDLAALAAVSGADQIMVSTGVGTWAYESGATARTSLGAQAQNDHLDDLAALGVVEGSNAIMVSTGFGAWAFQTEATFKANFNMQAGVDFQAWDAHLDDLAALAPASAADQFMVSTGIGTWALESGATVRTSLGLGTLATQNTINNTNWSGTDLAVVNGGTGASDAATARSNLGAQAQDAHLDDLAALPTATVANQVMVSTGAGVWALESGATLRTSLGLGTSDSVQFSTVTATLFELAGGAAGDTTLQRSRAGEMDIEGRPVIQHDSASMTGGRIRVQAGGSPSGGNNGDIWFIY